MDDSESDEKSKTLKSKANLEIQVGPIPIATDGGIVPGYGNSSAESPYDESMFICMQGPCRHLWQMTGRVNAGNPSGTWEALNIPEPRQFYHSCLAHPGTETELSRDDQVIDCNRWDPLSERELDALAERRRLYQIRRAMREPVETIDIDTTEGTP